MSQLMNSSSMEFHKNNEKRNMSTCKWAPILTLTGISGFLFGYDLCVVIVALPLIQTTFQLNLLQEQAIVGSLMVGAVVGSLLSGPIADGYGRKKTIQHTSFLFLLGGLLLGCATSFTTLIIGRVVVGLAVGASGPIVSVYISEISPAECRGRLVGFNEIMLCVGCVFAILFNSAIADIPYAWRYMLGFTAVPAVLQLIGMSYLPISPLWKASPQPWKFSIPPAKSPEKKRILLSIAIAVAQSLTGASSVLSYSHYILKLSNVHDTEMAEAAVAFAKLLGVLLSFVIVDKCGRKLLLVSGTIIMLSCHFLFATLFAFADAEKSQVVQWTLLVNLLLFIIAWNVSWAPLMWVLCAEILPSEHRSRGMGLTLAAFWMSAAVVNSSLLSLLSALSPPGTFLLFGCLSTCSAFFVHFFIPETKGKTLGEISALFPDTRRQQCSSEAYIYVTTPSKTNNNAITILEQTTF